MIFFYSNKLLSNIDQTDLYKANDITAAAAVIVLFLLILKEICGIYIVVVAVVVLVVREVQAARI